MIYIDTSAFVKKYYYDSGTEKIEDLFKEARQGKKTMYISYWGNKRHYKCIG